ncbi:MAG: DNA repair protein RadC [Flavobacteriales bacterium]|jgi:DNA repair protein RadC|nr:DNA repair protein RadC [Flavobacteriales bacterium]MBP9161384.1 DNA repair protein RadC [Flavobacteriales bacterium]MCI1754299.1 DNA repair protein RadC [Flavobacteriales bacterium]
MGSETNSEDKRLSIPNWDKGDRPRERMMAMGAKALSDAELVAILIRAGTPSRSALEVAREILAAAGNDLNALATSTPTELMKRPGVGEAKALSILAALELGQRRRATAPRERPRIATSAHVFEELRHKIADLHLEEFWMLMLDRGLRLIDSKRISIGGVHGTVADPKVIFRKALEAGASCIAVAHNHPSGQLRPSEEDIRLTKKLMEGGRFLDIIVQDHIIIAGENYYSFADNGQMS